MNLTQTFITPSGSPLRMLADSTDTCWFSANDLAVSLGYAKPDKAVATHCKFRTPRSALKLDEDADTLGISHQAIMIPESDVYRLIFGSELQSAEEFKDWVFEDVLPKLRKHGEYTKDDMSAAVTKYRESAEFKLTIAKAETAAAVSARTELLAQLQTIAWNAEGMLHKVEADFKETLAQLEAQLQKQFKDNAYGWAHRIYKGNVFEVALIKVIVTQTGNSSQANRILQRVRDEVRQMVKEEMKGM